MSIRHGLIGSLNPILYKEEGAQFYYRKTSGGIIMNNNPLISNIETVKGQTVAWNQQITDSYISGSNSSTSTYIVAKILTNNYVFKAHKVFVKGKILVNTNSFTHLYIQIDNQIVYDFKNIIIAEEEKEFSIITPTITNDTWHEIRFYGVGLTPEDGMTITWRDMNVFDLTLIYGTGKEPSTVAQFEADYQRWFGKSLTYEPYDAGSLRNVQMEGIKIVGFNLLNLERTEIVNKASTPTTKKEFNNNQVWKSFAFNGYSQLTNREFTITKNSISSTSGNDSYGAGFPIKAFPNTKYYYKTTFGAVGFFDVDGIHIGHFVYTSGVFTTPENCEWIVIVLGRTTGEWKEENPIVNFSQPGVKDGTYEPYEEHEVSIPVTTLKGKLNGEGESVVIFPDGMKGVGDIKDEIYYVGSKTYAVKRIGRVDLGSLTWIKNTTQNVFNLIYKPAKGSSGIATIGNIKSFKYITGTQSSVTHGNDGIAINHLSQIFIYDKNYIDLTPTQFKAAMQGVMLDYELAEPLVYEVDDFSLPVSYDCMASGTEQILPENDGLTVNVSPIMDITYKIKK